MARLAGAPARNLVVRLIYWLTRRKLGRVPTPSLVAGHHARILVAHGVMEQMHLGSQRVPAALKLLAQIRTATLVGCPF